MKLLNNDLCIFGQSAHWLDIKQGTATEHSFIQWHNASFTVHNKHII